ncbi:sensor histidine kinase [uncultured Robinsoniella sp.]|uniref:sensor histidine kinase n=1 Tax=uncultured Robinsoniella sp. TaxID=904190 RepID=UPI00374F17C3
MAKRAKRRMRILIGILFIYAACFLIYTLQEESQYRHIEDNLKRVSFTGVYESNTDPIPREYKSSTIIDANENSEVRLIGHFDQELKESQSLLFRIPNIRVKIYKDDKQIYSFGEPGTYPGFSRSPGNTWDIFRSPGIKTSDQIRIELENIYPNNVKTVYHLFIDQILSGDSGTLFHAIFPKVGLSVFLGGGVFILGCLLLIILFFLWLMKTPFSRKPLYFSFFAMISGLWFFFDFKMISLIIPYNVFNNIISMICFSTVMPLFGMYILEFLNGKTRIPIIASIYVQIGFTVYYLICQGRGIYDGYDLLNPLLIIMGISIVIIYGCLVYETIHNKNSETKFLLLVSSVLLLCGFDMENYFTTFTPTYTMTKIAYGLFMVIQFFYMLRCLQININEIKNARKLEVELAQNRIAIAISQIQPHFLYNSLTAIKQLCVIDPDRAEQAVGDFAGFLRENLDSLSSSSLISFQKELNHIRNYLALEQLRFGNRLKVHYDIQVSNFDLPSLSIQPMVENAVRYGVTKKSEGGTITISTKETEAGILIAIADDGAGFDMYHKKEDGRSHIGIDNVKNRLKAQCNGELTIESQLGRGTVVTILIQNK